MSLEKKIEELEKRITELEREAQIQSEKININKITEKIEERLEHEIRRTIKNLVL